MGLYDTFHGKCPSCGRYEEVQSKLFSCVMDNYYTGDTVNTVTGSDIVFEAKGGPCLGCNKPLIITVKDRVYLGFTNETPNFAEFNGGHTLPPSRK